MPLKLHTEGRSQTPTVTPVNNRPVDRNDPRIRAAIDAVYQEITAASMAEAAALGPDPINHNPELSVRIWPVWEELSAAYPSMENLWVTLRNKLCRTNRYREGMNILYPSITIEQQDSFAVLATTLAQCWTNKFVQERNFAQEGRELALPSDHPLANEFNALKALTGFGPESLVASPQ